MNDLNSVGMMSKIQPQDSENRLAGHLECSATTASRSPRVFPNTPVYSLNVLRCASCSPAPTSSSVGWSNVLKTFNPHFDRIRRRYWAITMYRKLCAKSALSTHKTTSLIICLNGKLTLHIRLKFHFYWNSEMLSAKE